MQALYETIKECKTTSTIIKTRLAEAEKNNEEIEKLRKGYLPVPIRGAICYFVIADMGNIDPMYQYSLTYAAAPLRAANAGSRRVWTKEASLWTFHNM